MIAEDGIDALTAWLVKAGLRGEPEETLVSGFCERAVAAGLPISRAQLLIDTLHPVYEGRVVRWGKTHRSLSYTNTAAPPCREELRICILRPASSRASTSRAGALVRSSACCRPGKACCGAASLRKAQKDRLVAASPKRDQHLD